MSTYSTIKAQGRARFSLFFIRIALPGWLLIFLACSSASDTNRHPRAPEPGTYRSSMMTSWLTVTPYAAGDPRMGSTPTNVDYGVGSTSFKGMFGDLILRENGTYALTGDKREGTWTYIPEKDSVGFTGLVGAFRTKYDYGKDNLTIYTGGAKMPDDGEINIRYTKKRERSIGSK